MYKYLASAGEIGGMIGKKLGLGMSRDLPVIRQKDDMVFCIILYHFIIIKTVSLSHSCHVSGSDHFLLTPTLVAPALLSNWSSARLEHGYSSPCRERSTGGESVLSKIH